MIQLIPPSIKTRIDPPKPITFAWGSVSNASSYTLYWGTNHLSYFWSTNIDETNVTISVTLPRSTMLFASVTATSVTGQESVYSNEARSPDWPYNAAVISWSPNSNVTIEASETMLAWSPWQSGNPPMTNWMTTDQMFFRARASVRLTIELLRLFNTNLNHYGG